MRIPRAAITIVSLAILAGTGVPALGTVVLEKRQEALANFPCMSCHKTISSQGVTFPLPIPHNQLQFRHHESIKGCFSCHNREDRNLLLLHTGTKVTFNESYKVCIQCHGEKGREFKLGIHGKQMGSWNGEKYRFSCTHCHEAHSPKFRKMVADPPPPFPKGKH